MQMPMPASPFSAGNPLSDSGGGAWTNPLAPTPPPISQAEAMPLASLIAKVTGSQPQMSAPAPAQPTFAPAVPPPNVEKSTLDDLNAALAFAFAQVAAPQQQPMQHHQQQPMQMQMQAPAMPSMQSQPDPMSQQMPAPLPTQALRFANPFELAGK
jgi:hypothetical protein